MVCYLYSCGCPAPGSRFAHGSLRLWFYWIAPFHNCLPVARACTAPLPVYPYYRFWITFGLVTFCTTALYTLPFTVTRALRTRLCRYAHRTRFFGSLQLRFATRFWFTCCGLRLHGCHTWFAAVSHRTYVWFTCGYFCVTHVPRFFTIYGCLRFCRFTTRLRSPCTHARTFGYGYTHCTRFVLRLPFAFCTFTVFFFFFAIFFFFTLVRGLGLLPRLRARASSMPVLPQDYDSPVTSRFPYSSASSGFVLGSIQFLPVRSYLVLPTFCRFYHITVLQLPTYLFLLFDSGSFWLTYLPVQFYLILQFTSSLILVRV